MIGMKGDMPGAAVPPASFPSTPGQPPVSVRGYLPFTDNMPGGDATRGRMLRIRNGKTVEVLNTDAEGRLVLADALSLASEYEPDAIADLARLSGAAVMALGDEGGHPHGQRRGVHRPAAAADVEDGPVWPLLCRTTCAARSIPRSPDMKNVASAR